MSTAKRNWVTVHPHIMGRHLKTVLPEDASVYLDLSGASSSESSSLGARIASMLPTLCQKYDGSLITARDLAGSHALQVASHNIHLVTQLLHEANTFAARQLNGVPDGQPLRMVSVGDLVGPGAAIGHQDDLKSIASWPAKVPVRVEPIDHRRDLFVGDRTYWLIGLAGDMGRSMCEFMAQQGARHLVLTTRSLVMDRAWIESVRRQWGAVVSVRKGDISVQSDIRRVHDEIVAEMPPIAGVANGTLVLRDRGLVNMDLDTFHANTRCKVEGTIYLDEIFSDNTLDWVCFSFFFPLFFFPLFFLLFTSSHTTCLRLLILE